MSSLVISCPNTGKFVPTGIEVEREVYLDLPNVLIAVTCPACGRLHRRRVGDAFLATALPNDFPELRAA